MKVEKKEEYGKLEVTFTDWQCHIIKMWAEHPTIAEASESLEISKHTFQTHLRRMRHKIQVRRTFDVYLFMKNQNLI